MKISLKYKKLKTYDSSHSYKLQTKAKFNNYVSLQINTQFIHRMFPIKSSNTDHYYLTIKLSRFEERSQV